MGRLLLSGDYQDPHSKCSIHAMQPTTIAAAIVTAIATTPFSCDPPTHTELAAASIPTHTCQPTSTKSTAPVASSSPLAPSCSTSACVTAAKATVT